MLSVRIIPLLLFKGDGLYKGVQFGDHKYVGDALNTVRIFTQKQAHELVLLDIAATAEGRTIPPDLVSRISQECLMPLTVGGGVCDVDAAQALLNAGAEKIAVNSHAVRHPKLVRDIADVAGSQAVIAAIDVRRSSDGYEVFTHCGTQPTGRKPTEVAEELVAAGAGEILLTSIDRDGTGKGFDLELVAEVAAVITVPLIACGGAGSLAHFGQAVREGGATAVAAGSKFVFHGRRRAVLVSFPTVNEIEVELGREDMG